MKLHFEGNLDYQHDAIEAVCDLFHGQESRNNVFTVTMAAAVDQQMLAETNNVGVGNGVILLDDQVLSNLKAVQLRNALKPSDSLGSFDFTIEMETGTGKTYVYLRSIFELNQRFGFTKFVIVVPSVAIKEGVYKSLQMTEEHFRSLYANVPFEYFLYDSTKLGQVRNFATSSNIQIMVVTVGAINKKDVNNLYKETEKTGGDRPIDLIKATRPIIIVDEPQSVDGGLEGQGKKALGEMHPLCTLRYSATHVHEHHMIYKLDSVDAYERKLVKQIEVASLQVEGGHNKAYARLLSTSNKGGRFTAKLELDVQRLTGVVRAAITVRLGDDLQQVTGREIYANCVVQNIGCRKGAEFLELSNLEEPLAIGQAIGDVNADEIARLMIRRTIEEHLEKEKRLRVQHSVKVLSLFFIDRVEFYRGYAADGTPIKGKYALMFEEEYRKAAELPRFCSLFNEVDLEADATEVHNGYFSIDRKGGWTDTSETNAANRENAERAYNLIMKDKEKLLSFDTKLKFIFSHSALKEGWDSPNVFQICAIREMNTELQRRQTIGRGLRLCVNQSGERLRGFDINTLTVIATESYEQFAANLQTEIEKETGIRFGIVEPHQFAGLAFLDNTGEFRTLDYDQSAAVWHHLQQSGYLSSAGKVQDTLRLALKEDTVEIPEQFTEAAAPILDVLRKAAGRLEIKNADERRQIPVRKEVLHSPEFTALWERIKHKTTYRVQFDNAKLIADCTLALRKAPPVTKTRVQISKANIAITEAGVDAIVTSSSAPIVLEERDVPLPDLLTELQDKTQLTRRSLARMVLECGRLDDFRRNPQQFIEFATQTINSTKREALVDGIKYVRLGDDCFYAQELFEKEELSGYLKDTLETKKSVHERVVYDSGGIERSFAADLELNEAVKVYAKLPGWFTVPTPLGTYNPDWAVLVDQDGAERLYFVVETKGTLNPTLLRSPEAGKIQCGEAHFEALAVGDNPVKFVVARDVGDVMRHLR